MFVDDVLFDARQKVCGAVAPHAAVDDLDLFVGVKQAELARRDLDVAHAEIVGIEQVAARLGNGVAEKYDLHSSPHFAYFALYALMHFLMISTASSRCAISRTVVFLCSSDLYTSKKCIISSNMC